MPRSKKRLTQAAAVLRDAKVPPVVVRQHPEDEHSGYVDEIVTEVSGFQKEDVPFGDFRETTRHYGTSGTGADYDEIEGSKICKKGSVRWGWQGPNLL